MSSSKIEMEEKDIEFVAKLPKIELHLHLDGSLSPGKFKRATCVRIISKKHVYLAKVNFFLDIKNKITSSY
jgi:adenosine deaminase